MASPAVMSTVLQTLPPRPPTPPREPTQDLELRTGQLNISTSLQPPASSLHTPPSAHSPASGDSTSRRKRVGFSARAEYREPPVYPEGETKRVPTPISLPGSASKPVKSILKATPLGPNPLRTSTTSLELSDSNVKLGVMLDSTIQQLAGADRDSRLDAYMMLVRALKASNNLPDRVALQEKMGLFQQFMLRDIMAKSTTTPIDSPLVNQALGLLIALLHFPAIASTLTSDFSISIVDHCIRSFEDSHVPKEVVRHLMQVIAVQNFSAMKVMTSDRVGRLVAAVRKIEDHLKGKSIIMSRVLIYSKLVKQVRHLMAVHSDWLLDLFTDMLSELKEIRSSAINLGLEAGFTIGKEKNISRKVMELFNQTHDEKRYIEFYQERLRTMAKGKAESAAVPQIWSVIVLFLRCPMDKWDGFSSWLKIIQGCFNGADMRTRIEANVAWSRLGYVMLMDDRSISKAVPILTQPFLAQLKRKAVPGKYVDDFRDAVVGGVRHLLYYTFKPNANLQLLDGQWDVCVKPLLKQMLDRPAAFTYDGTFHATVILSGLFDCVTPRVWNPERAMDKQLIQADELPAIDSKWLRRNAARVFELVEPILLQNIASVRDVNSPTYKLWRNLVTAVASAASKEIKVSLDTAVFVAHAFNTLQKIWKKGPQEGTETGAVFLKAVQTYLGVMIESLGLLPFTEKLLAVDKEFNFVPMATPSHRPGKNPGLIKSPLKHMFSILCALPHGIQDDDSFATFFSAVFSPFLAAKSDKGRMDLAQELISTVPMEAMIPYGPWKFTADVVAAWLEAGHSSLMSTSSSGDTPVGHEYRDVVRILERGMRSAPNLPWSHWQGFFHALVNRVREETGEAGVAIAVIEPLAKIVSDRCMAGGVPIVSPTLAKCITELLSAANQPRDRQAVDAARRRLWGAGSRSATFDTFDHLYKSVNLFLNVYYIKGADNDGRISALLKGVGSFLERCNPQLLTRTLIILQDGLAPWVEDKLAETHRKPADVDDTIKSVWQQICSILRGYEGLQRLPLDDLEPLLCAAFKSKHRQVVNSALSLWNIVFEQVEEVEYPAKLREVLLSLRPFVDIVLPGLDVSSIESTGPEPMFVDTQEEELELPKHQRPRSSGRGTPQPSGSSNLRSSSVGLSMSSKRRQELTPEMRPSKAQRRSATPKLRHEDSQIQFAAIESSPLPSAEPKSQVLTERQREVRERQKEVANLFPEIRSSPARKVRQSSRQSSRNSSRASSPQKLPTLRAATPEPRISVEEFIASTPTPRRGQVVALPDSDIAEPPSSPPEPRRNPLAKEIQSRSATNSLMDEWQFSSSPVSGSPVLDNHEHAIVESSQMMEVDEFQLDDEDGDSQADSHDKPEPELGESVVMESMVEDSVLIDHDDEPAAGVDSSALDLTASELGLPEPAAEAAVAEVPAAKPVTVEATSDVSPANSAAKVPEASPEAAPDSVVEVESEPSPEATTDAAEAAPKAASEVVEDPAAAQPSKSETTSPAEDPSTPKHHRHVDAQAESKSQASAAVEPAETPTTANSRRSSRKKSQKISKPLVKRTSSRRKAASQQSMASQPADESFNGSEIDNSSLVRLVVELDSAKVNQADYEYRQQTETPELKRIRELTATPQRNRTQERANLAQDCIVVSSPVRKGDVMVSAPLTDDVDDEMVDQQQHTVEPEVVPNSQVSASSQGRKKRKRGGFRGSQAAAKRRKSLQLAKSESQELGTPAVVDLTEDQSQEIQSCEDYSQSTQKTEDRHREEVDLSAPAVENDSDVEHEVQSQIIEETERHLSHSEVEVELPVADKRVVDEVADSQPQLQESTEMHTAVERVEEDSMQVGATVSSTGKSAEVPAPAQPAPGREESPFQKILGFFKGGLDALRGAALSRNEVYQLEDVFRDVRRELIDAEDRGRAQRP
ncbi:Rap1-interacting factor 1 N terminal-domain-containing protein [Coniochaeta sp. 2T2.1]|nr:Rap1-interacting factor 1 N terminal-domain-containing protein [Coniochaeta sp. 2T2.1]